MENKKQEEIKEEVKEEKNPQEETVDEEEYSRLPWRYFRFWIILKELWLRTVINRTMVSIQALR